MPLEGSKLKFTLLACIIAAPMGAILYAYSDFKELVKLYHKKTYGTCGNWNSLSESEIKEF